MQAIRFNTFAVAVITAIGMAAVPMWSLHASPMACSQSRVIMVDANTPQAASKATPQIHMWVTVVAAKVGDLAAYNLTMPEVKANATPRELAAPVAPWAQGPLAVTMLKDFKGRSKIIGSPALVIISGDMAAVVLNSSNPRMPSAITQFLMTLGPRLNSDNTIALSVEAELTMEPAPNGSLPKPNPMKFNTSSTVKDGDTILLRELYRAGNNPDDKDILVFITPEIVRTTGK